MPLSMSAEDRNVVTTLADAARRADVDYQVLLRRVMNGQLQTAQPQPGGPHIVSMFEVYRCLEKHPVAEHMRREPTT